jgi:hypothetical protein
MTDPVLLLSAAGIANNVNYAMRGTACAFCPAHRDTMRPGP